MPIVKSLYEANPPSARLMPLGTFSGGFGAAMAAAGRAPLKPPPPSLHVPQRHEGASASHRASPATSATGSAMSAGSTYSPADDRSDGDPGRTRKGRRRRQPSGSTRGSGSTSPSWAESSMWADQQVGPDRSMGAAVAPGAGAGAGSSSRNTPVGGGTPVDDRTPVRRRTPARTNCTPPLVATIAGSRTPPFAPGATGTGVVEETRVSCPRCHGFITTAKEGDVTGAVMRYSPDRHKAVTAMRAGFSAGEGARVAPPPPINTRPLDTVVNRTSASNVRTPPMVRPPPPRTTAPSPPAPPPPSQRAPSPPAGGNTGGGPRGGGGGGGLRAPEPPPVQAPLPPTTETRDRDGSLEWKWASSPFPVPSEDEPLMGKSEVQEQGMKGLGVVGVSEGQRGLTAEGMGMGGIDLGLGGQGQGAPEGFRPPRLRMYSNSNHDSSRAAVPKYNDKRLSYKFSDQGALTLKNFGIRIGSGGVRDYSEEVLSPTGHNGNGIVGPFFSSSGGGDQWVSLTHHVRHH